MTSAADETGVRPTTRRGWWLVGGILLLALALRLAVAIEVGRDYVPRTDARHYDFIASSLANGDGYGSAQIPPAVGPSAFRAPLYPLSLAAVYKVFGAHSTDAGLAAQAVTGTAVVLLIGVVAAQLWGRRVGAVAMLIAAAHPTLLLFGASLQLEPLLALLLLATVAAALHARRVATRILWPIVTGGLVGLTILTRELGFALLLPVVWLIWTSRTAALEGNRRWSRQALAAPALVVVVAIGVVAPWTIRNAMELNAFVPVTTTAGFGLVGTYNETSYARKDDPAPWLQAYDDPATARLLLDLNKPDEVEMDRALREAGLEFMADHPAYVPKVLFWNTVRLFDLRGTRDAFAIARYLPYPGYLTRLSVYGSYLIGALALVALALRRTRQAPYAIWFIPLLAVVTIVVISGNIRYRASIEPFTLLLASVAVTAGLEKLGVLRGRGSRP